MSNRGKVHIVKAGESVSSIAQKYGFGANWRPIWNYNHAVLKHLPGNDPDKISVGVSIVMPKTASEYDAAIVEMRQLAVEVQRSMLVDLQKLDEDYNSLVKNVSRAVDFAADVAMAAKGLVKASFKLGSRYLTYTAKKEVLKVFASATEKVLDVHSDNAAGISAKAATSAITKNSLVLMNSHAVPYGAMAGSFGKSVAKQATKQAAVFVTKAVAPAEAANGLAELTSILCSAALTGVEAVSPSNVAKFAVWASTGETPEDTYRWAKHMITDGHRRSFDQVRATERRLLDEKRTVHSM